jgi:hypothetical protein
MNSEPDPGDQPPPPDPSLRGGQNTFATNPAMLKLNAGPWLAANPSTIYVTLGFVLVGLVVIFFKWLPGTALLVAALWNFFKDIRQAKQKFWGGDVCPAVVLSAQEGLVAAYTDLVAAGDRPYPAIQIFKQPLHRFTTGAAHDGMRVATAAFYFGNVREDAWKNFQPEVINCVIHDPVEIERVLNSIPEEQWQMLDACVASLADRKEGLHHVDLSGAANGQLATVTVIPPKPWFLSREAMAPLVAIAIIAVILAFAGITAFVGKNKTQKQPESSRPVPGLVIQRPAMPQSPAMPQPPVMPQPGPTPTLPAAAQHPSSPPQNFPNHAPPQQPAQTGPFSVGSAVEADWAGGWVPGKITAVNYGGFSVMVQLEDGRFPQPIVLGTNQIRLK